MGGNMKKQFDVFSKAVIKHIKEILLLKENKKKEDQLFFLVLSSTGLPLL